MRASTNQLEQRITTVECTNEELQQQTQQFQDVTSTSILKNLSMDCVQDESTIVVCVRQIFSSMTLFLTGCSCAT
jgi:hypothetical protein